MESESFRLNIEPRKEGEFDVAIKMPPEFMEHIRSLNPGKSAKDYLKEYIGKKEYNYGYSSIRKAIGLAVPLDIKKGCPKCDESVPKPVIEEKDVYILGNCDSIKSEMEGTFFLAELEFVNLVQKNKHLLQDKVQLKQLCREFFLCFRYIEGGGKLYFDLSRMHRSLLQHGLLSIATLLDKQTTLKSLNYINEALDEINMKSIEGIITEKKESKFDRIQRNFFLDKQVYFKEKERIEGANKQVNTEKRGSSEKRPNRTDIAYCIYYLENSGELRLENKFPSIKAWKEIGLDYKKNHVNIQKMYNSIFRDSSYRVNHSKKHVIQFVVENMLNDYPKSLDLATKELESIS